MLNIAPSNIVTDWLTDAANAMTDSLNNARIDNIKTLVSTSLPTPEQVQSDWYSVALGGALGFAQSIMTLVAVVVALIMAFSPRKNHAVRIKRTLSSMGMVAVVGALFYRVYSLLYGLSQAGALGVANFAIGKSNATIKEMSDLLVPTVLPSDPVTKLFISFIGWLFSLAALGLAYVNNILVLIVSIGFILTMALRPIGKKTSEVFNATVAGIWTTLATPILISVGILLPVITDRYIPFGATAAAAGVSTIIGSAIAVLGPVLFAMWAFNKSSEIFGTTESNITNGLRIDDLPTVTNRQLRDDVASTGKSGFGAFATTVGIGAVTGDLPHSDNLLGDLKNLMVEGATAAAAATGHPGVAALGQAIDTTMSKEKRKHRAQNAAPGVLPAPALAPLPPPTGQPVQLTPVPTTTAAAKPGPTPPSKPVHMPAEEYSRQQASRP